MKLQRGINKLLTLSLATEISPSFSHICQCDFLSYSFSTLRTESLQTCHSTHFLFDFVQLERRLPGRILIVGCQQCTAHWMSFRQVPKVSAYNSNIASITCKSTYGIRLHVRGRDDLGRSPVVALVAAQFVGSVHVRTPVGDGISFSTGFNVHAFSKQQ